MFLKDDRTAEQKLTHTCIVLATDKFMSGCGEAKGGPSYAGWACTPNMVEIMEARLRARNDMKRVRMVSSSYRPPSGLGHCHIYIAKE